MRKHISENEIDLLLSTLRRLYRRNARVGMYKLISRTHPAVMAVVFRHLEDTERRDVFQYIRRMEGYQEFLEELDDTIIEELLITLTSQEIDTIISDLPPEEIADILQNVQDDLAKKVHGVLDQEERREVEEILQYPEDSAGRIMTTEFLKFQGGTSVAQTILEFQTLATDMDAPFYIYVVNDLNQMMGVLSLRQLLLHPPETQLNEIMESEFIAVSVDTDQEQVAVLVSRYNFLALPVIDHNNHLVGIVTVDDVLDVLREEATEDILRMAGAGDDREILLKSTLESARIRFPWLMASWIGGIFALGIIGAFESILSQTVVLAGFIPIIMGMGGNVGTQTSTIIVRGIATGRVRLNEVSKVVLKEIRIGMLLGILYGILLGVLTYFRYLQYSDPLMLGVVVGSSVFIAMTIAVTIGSAIPLVLSRMDIDPAISTGPFVTTAIDILGVLIYFYIASLLLNI